MWLGASQDNILDFAMVKLRNFGQDGLNAMRGEIVRASYVERASKRLGEGCSSTSDHNCFSHYRLSLGSCKVFLVKVGKSLSLFNQLNEERRGRPKLSVVFLKFANAFEDFGQPNCIRIPHGTAAMDREAVAIQIDDIDIHRPQSVPFLEYASALINESIDASVNDFLGRDLPLFDSRFAGPLPYHIGNFRIGYRAPVLVILVPARASLLTVAAHFAQSVLG